MGSQPEPNRRAATETVAIEHLVERLKAQFPELPPEEIVLAVKGEYEQHASSRIRDFVPILTERSVKRQLAEPHRHRA